MNPCQIIWCGNVFGISSILSNNEIRIWFLNKLRKYLNHTLASKSWNILCNKHKFHFRSLIALLKISWEIPPVSLLIEYYFQLRSVRLVSFIQPVYNFCLRWPPGRPVERQSSWSAVVTVGGEGAIPVGSVSRGSGCSSSFFGVRWYWFWYFPLAFSAKAVCILEHVGALS